MFTPRFPNGYLLGPHVVPKIAPHSIPTSFSKGFALVIHIGSPRVNITIYAFQECLKYDDIFLLMGQSKRPITTTTKKNFGYSHNSFI
jgi:hypothetical protein